MWGTREDSKFVGSKASVNEGRRPAKRKQGEPPPGASKKGREKKAAAPHGGSSDGGDKPDHGRVGLGERKVRIVSKTHHEFKKKKKLKKNLGRRGRWLGRRNRLRPGEQDHCIAWSLEGKTLVKKGVTNREKKKVSDQGRGRLIGCS